MPAPISKDIRKRIIEARKQGDSIEKIAREKSVNRHTVMRLVALYQETGSYEPRALNNGRKPKLDEKMLAKIRKRIEEQPDITLYELKEEFCLPVSLPALCKTINGKLGLRRKKNGVRSRTAPDGCGAQEEFMETEPINT